MRVKGLECATFGAYQVAKWRRLCWKIQIIQSDCRLLWKVQLKTLNLALVGGNPHYFSLLFNLVCPSCFVFLCVFQVKCLSFKFGGAFSYVVPDLRHPSGIVFLVTLGTMCHFSLGVGQTYLSFYLFICVVFFFQKKKNSMLLIGHDLTS